MHHNNRNFDSCAFYFTTSAEVIDTVKSLKSTDSAGYDEIPVTVLKAVVIHIAEPISAIINVSLADGVFPDGMKTAKVCPIFKSEIKNDVANYRPISILTTFSKIFEKIIANRLISFIDKNNILTSSQYGFRKNIPLIWP